MGFEKLKAVLPFRIRSFLIRIYSKKLLKDWKLNGCPIPPPHVVKENIIHEYREKTGIMLLIETGTFLGDMVEAQKKCFVKIISIELSLELFNKAKRRFKRERNVEIIYGDSGEILPRVLSKINDPAIFWLDGHYSEGNTARGDTTCPVYKELSAIFESKIPEYVILIDDARCFTGEGDFPEIGKLTEFIKTRNANCEITNENDIIRIVQHPENQL